MGTENRRGVGAVAGLLVACAITVGCGRAINNDRLNTGWWTPPALQPLGTNPSLLSETGERSVMSVDRSNWSPLHVELPHAGVEHHPNSTAFGPVYASDTRRSRGAYPTLASAVDVGSDGGAQAAELFAAPFVGAADILLWIPRMFIDPPGTVMLSTGEVRERTALDPAEVHRAALLGESGERGAM